MDSPLLIWDFFKYKDASKFKDDEIKEVIELLENTDKINNILQNGALKPSEYVAVLLYKALNYNDGNFWSSKPPIKTRLQQRYFKEFFKFLKRKNLFIPKITSGNRQVNTILVHIFIPSKYLDQFLDFVYFLYEKYEGDYETIKNLSKYHLRELITKRNMIRVFQILTEYEETTAKLKNIISEIFAIWNNENITVSFPFKMYESLEDYIKSKKIFRNTSKVLEIIDNLLIINPKYKKYSYLFLDQNYKKIWFSETDLEIKIHKPPSYLLLKKEGKIFKNFNSHYKDIIYTEDVKDDFLLCHIYDVLDIEEILQEILKKKVNIIPEGNYITLQGEEVNEFLPIDRGARIYKDSFEIVINKPNEIKNLIIKLPNGKEIALKSVHKTVERFSYPGIYEIIYSTPLRQNLRRTIAVLGSKDIPFIDLRKPCIRYKGECIEESNKNIRIFGTLLVKPNIPYNLQIEIKGFTAKIKILGLRKPLPGLKLCIYDKCGFKIDSIPINKDEITIYLDNYKKFLSKKITLHLCIGKFKGIKKIIQLHIRDKKLCPSEFLWKNLLEENWKGKFNSNYKFSYKYDDIRPNPFIQTLNDCFKKRFSSKKDLEQFLNSKRNIRNLWDCFKNRLYLLNKYLHLEEAK